MCQAVLASPAGRATLGVLAFFVITLLLTSLSCHLQLNYSHHLALSQSSILSLALCLFPSVALSHLFLAMLFIFISFSYPLSVFILAALEVILNTYFSCYWMIWITHAPNEHLVLVLLSLALSSEIILLLHRYFPVISTYACREWSALALLFFYTLLVFSWLFFWFTVNAQEMIHTPAITLQQI